jgi:hypothetical protein
MSGFAHDIDGKLLVLTDKTALPLRCVKTNQPVEESEYRTWDLPWIPSWLRILMLTGVGFLFFVPFIVRRRCHLKAGLSRSAWLRFFISKLVAVFLIVGPFIPPMIFSTLRMDEWAFYSILCLPILVWVGLIILIMGSSPLSVAKHKGDRFWIRGCSPAFLESLRESVEAKASTVA